MPIRIAAIADAHYRAGDLAACGKRRTAIGDILLLRAVHRLNRYIKPDLTIILGDLIDDPSDPNALEDLQRLKATVDLLESPVIVIPGNHDGDIGRFYGVFERLADPVDAGGVRFVTFTDPEEPGYNARRTDFDLKRMDSARAGHDGPIVSVQHVPLFEPGSSPCPHNYTNVSEVWGAFERNHFTLALSGHHHAGDDLAARGAGPAVIVPALCESPFQFLEITIDGDRVETRRHQLAMPPELGLFDYHVHTTFAYCQENLDMPLSLALAGEMGLAGMAFTEHSGQLYFEKKTFWGAAFMRDGIDTTEGVRNRMPEFLAEVERFRGQAILGLEIDCDYSGRPVVLPDDLRRFDLRVGAVHWLEELRKPEPDLELAGQELLARTDRFLASGLDVLAHPFRAFRRSGMSEGLSAPMVELLRKHGVAAEVNFHLGAPPDDFVQGCIDSGVKLVFGSDSHNLYEIGEFSPHLDLLRRCGISTSDLPTVMADFAHKSLCAPPSR